MKHTTRSFVVMLAMIAAGIAGWFFEPRTFLADTRPPIQLNEIVPPSFSDWQELSQSSGLVVNPQVQEKLDAIYSQLLSRTYINSTGDRVMLSIAYGRDQRSNMAVHYPEVCYPAQGFSVTSSKVEDIALDGSAFQVRRLETQLGRQRFEPVTYWTTIGGYRSLGGFKKRLSEMKYGLNGEVPDGLLFRVSTIGKDSDEQFKLQTRFIDSLLRAVSPEKRLLLTGSEGA